MILIADSGSTKTEWREIEGGKAGRSYISSGINPFFISSDEIVRLLGKELPEMKGAGISRVFFYGTGVSNAAKADIVRAPCPLSSGQVSCSSAVICSVQPGRCARMNPG
jgi:glucosamine kinase